VHETRVKAAARNSLREGGVEPLFRHRSLSILGSIRNESVIWGGLGWVGVGWGGAGWGDGGGGWGMGVGGLGMDASTDATTQATSSIR